MKNKSTLALIELAIMLLVFAAAAAMCMGAFARAQELSNACNARDRALLQAQNAAEAVKSCAGRMDEAALLLGGSCSGGTLRVYYDEHWERLPQEGEYLLEVSPAQSGYDLLGKAHIRVLRSGECLIQMEAAWQEVSPDG